MSVIRKKPFIEMVIDSLSPAMKDALAGVLNNQPATINSDSSFADMPSVNTVTAVYFKLDETNFKNGILIYNNSYCVLVAYHRFQDLLIYQLNVAAKQYTKINEYLDINELRRVLNDRVGKDIDAGEIDSGSATAGKVLAADGAGGAEWVDVMDAITPETVQAGDAVQLFGFNSQGQLVKDDMPEGITVDQSVIEDSTNAVAGGAVYDELAPMKEDITELQGEMETKANVDGNYPTMTVGVADQLSPYDEESGDDQDEPFNFQATGTGNGTQPDFATGAIALMKEKQGNTVVVNQLVNQANIPASETSNDITFTYANGIMDIDGTASATAFSTTQEVNLIAGHKYLKSSLTIPNATNSYVQVYDSSNSIAYQDDLFTATYSNENTYFRIRIESGLQVNHAKCYMFLIDLTQWFNGDIPSDLLSHPENFLRYYQGSLAYNEGTLVNADGRYVKCIGRNQWDEDWELGGIETDGSLYPDNDRIRSKNYIRVIPNTEYYFYRNGSNSMRICYYDKDYNFISYDSNANQTHTTPSNCLFIKIVIFGTTTYNNNITISLYYEDESGYDQYYPYEVLTNNDTGTETLLAFDKKLSSGLIEHNTGEIIFTGQETGWTYSSDGYFIIYKADIATKAEEQVNFISSNGIVCKKVGSYFFVSTTANPQLNSSTDMNTIFSNGTKVQYLYNDANKTTEQGTPYSENLVIDDFGSMDFSGTSGVPQGNLIFYPVDYKAFIDTLYNYTEGTPSNIALKSDLAVVNEKIGAKLPECPTTTDGTYVLKATVSDGEVVYAWVLEE